MDPFATRYALMVHRRIELLCASGGLFPEEMRCVTPTGPVIFAKFAVISVGWLLSGCGLLLFSQTSCKTKATNLS
jgi:hypothetical protein